jgi:hypothetical protein
MDMTVEQAQEILIERVDKVQSRAKTRLCGDWSTHNFLVLLLEAVCLSARGVPFEDIEAEIHGGGVSNNYNYRADSTYLRLSDGRVWVYRGSAKSGPGGDVTNNFVRVRGRGKQHRDTYRKAGMTARGGYWYL